MKEVQFQEERYSGYRTTNYQSEKEPKMITLLIKSGIVKDKKQANIFLLCCAVFFIFTSVYAFSKTVDKTPEVVPYDELTQQQKQEVPIQERMYLESVKNN